MRQQMNKFWQRLTWKQLCPQVQLSLSFILFIAFLFAPLSRAGVFPFQAILQAGAAQGADPLFVFSDTGATFKVSANLNATANGNGSFTVTSGSGFFNADPIVLIPGSGVSPLGAFNYDNVLYPAATPKLDIAGLLFRDTVTSAELNIWGNAGGSYSTYVGVAAGNYSLQNNSSTITLAQAPEPGTWMLMVVGLSVMLFWKSATPWVAGRTGNGRRSPRELRS
jgi:hypothetical protein